MSTIIDMGILADDILAQAERTGRVVSGNTPGVARCDCIWWRYVDHYLPGGKVVRQWFNLLGVRTDDTGAQYEDYDEYIEVLD